MFWKRAKEVHISGHHFNQAVDAWKNAGQAFKKGRTTELDHLVAEVVRHCQLSLEADNKNGDAYVLLADALLLAAISVTRDPNDKRYKYLTSRAAAVICYWNNLPFKSYPVTKGKHATRGGELYGLLCNIVAAEAASSTVNDTDQIMKELSSKLTANTVSPSSFGEVAQVICTEPHFTPVSKAEVLEEIFKLRETLSIGLLPSRKGFTGAEANVIVRKVSPLIVGAFPVKEEADKDQMNEWLKHPLINCPLPDEFMMSVASHTPMPVEMAERILRQLLEDKYDTCWALAEERVKANSAQPQARKNQGLAHPTQTKSDGHTAVYKDTPRILQCGMNTAQWHKCLGEAYNAQCRFDDAVAEFKEALTIDPNDAEAHYRLGLAYENRGRPDDAIEQYKKALKIDSNYDEALNDLEKAYDCQSKANETIRQYKEALRVNLNDAEAHLRLGFVYYEDQGKLNEAITEFKEALGVNPNNAEAHLRLGNVYHDQGRPDEAIREYREALRISPNDCVVHYNLGTSYATQGRLDEAIAELKDALRINPRYTTARYRLGKEYQAQGKLDQAITEYSETLSIIPSFAYAHNSLGLAYQAQGRLDEAVREFKEALLIDPGLAQAYSNLGLAYRAQGNFYEGVAQFKEALTIDPNDAGAIYGLGTIFEDQGELEHAIRCYQATIQLASALPDYASIVGQAENRISQFKELA